MAYKDSLRLLHEGMVSLDIDDNNITQENGDALLLELTETLHSAGQFHSSRQRRRYEEEYN